MQECDNEYATSVINHCTNLCITVFTN